MAKKDKEGQQRIAVIDYDSCQPGHCNYLCERCCPVNRMGKKCIVTDEESKKPVISEELCTGCGICPNKCPFQAISIINLSAALGKPLHRFGQNGFCLYRLPYPKPNLVVGLIGKNGIGKSTALKIISAKIKPNLGDLEEETPIEKIVEYFRGKEIQNFFEKLKKGSVKVSFKPQNVDELLHAFKGKVSELLKKVDERKKLNEVVKQLGLETVLERQLKQLSGGELQKTAIAAALLREAEVYCFDEPSSYLDVSERLRMARALRSMASGNKSVLVIEHDLAVLDYLSDDIHILFGKQAAYGVVSNPKSVKNGINEFLQGFLRDENLRFRDSELSFEAKPPADVSKKKALVKYPALEKKFKGFSLSVESGELREGEILGVLGPNATGKTTFVKMLAGIEKADNTKVDLKLKIAFKPQYIVPEKNKTVQELFESAEFDNVLFEQEVERRLKVKRLFEKKLETLSGGELQKVAVAFALCRKSDLLLLDEPSAFIDVEDRLKLADAVRAVTDKKKKIAIVVDHDILFQDYISDRLIVFEGEQSKKGFALKPMPMEKGMNHFLKNLKITFRRDPQTGRPRANKPDSAKDQEQKKSGNYYYQS